MKVLFKSFLSLLWLVTLFGCVTPRSLPETHVTTEASKNKIVAIQYPIESGKTSQEFIDKFERYVFRAKDGGAVLAIFPELLTLDVWPKASLDSDSEILKKIARETTPLFVKAVLEISQKHQISILAGSTPFEKDGKILNRAYLVFPSGKKVFQDKIFPTDWERRNGISPGERLSVFDTPWGRTAILICYDAEFPSLSKELSRYKPEVILIPSMTESVQGLNRVRWSAQARAVEHHAYVVVAGTVGTPAKDWVHFGQNVILTPQEPGFSGILSEGQLGRTEIIYGDLDIGHLRASRKNSKFYPAKDEIQRGR